MFHVVLVEPEIPPNTGNVIRLCANAGVQLHLVEPLGFLLDDAKLRRAGLDYHEFASVKVYPDWDDFIEKNRPEPLRMFAMSAHGPLPFSECEFRPGDVFVFGSETKGLPDIIRERFTDSQFVRLPMLPGLRSINLSNCVAVVVYEAWRQNGYTGGT